MICMTCVTNSRMEKKVIMMIVSQQARSPIQLVSYRNSVQAQSAASPSQYITLLSPTTDPSLARQIGRCIAVPWPVKVGGWKVTFGYCWRQWTVGGCSKLGSGWGVGRCAGHFCDTQLAVKS